MITHDLTAIVVVMTIRLTMIMVTLAAQLPKAPPRSDVVLVTRVWDGDTIDVATIGRVRLLGIDAPEVSHGLDSAAPYGNEARDRLSSLVLRRYVRLEYDAETQDTYRRRLAYLLLEDGTLINAVLAREGLARVSARMPLARLNELRRAEEEAKRLRRGIWGAAPRTVSRRSVGRGFATSPRTGTDRGI